MPTQDEAYETLMSKIQQLGATTKQPNTVLKLAEAYAWLVSPGNAHGGGHTEAK